MKACIIQPPYSRDVKDSEEFFQFKMQMLDSCDETVDIIVLPEYSDVPCATETLEETLFYHNMYIGRLLDKCVETAIRCSAIVFVNALSLEADGYRNTTYVFDRQGKLVGKYFKKHLPPLELETLMLDREYTFEYSEPYVLEIEGLRFGFLTCYDFYFYEAFANIARNNVDIIIGCSLQRSDTHSAIEIMCRFLAYNTNAYVLRSSVSFSEDSDICGASMAVAPTGDVLENMKGRFGKAIVEFDPNKKYFKPAGYGNPEASHYQYIEYGRKPWQYRLGGSTVVAFDKYMQYPRVCAHRGFNTIAPENSLPAFGAAIAMGADEIEFDIWPTKDGEIVSCHDATLDRVSNGTGKVYEHTLAELLELDFGVKFGETFKGLKIPTFEDILKKLGGQTVMNVHIKPLGEHYDPEIMKKIVDLVRKYDCARHVYFMIEKDDDVALFKSYAPEIAICLGHDRNRPWDLVDRAIEVGADKIQLFCEYINKEMIDKAHANGIICNYFYCDNPDEAQKFRDWGVDTLLTNDYHLVSKEFKK